MALREIRQLLSLAKPKSVKKKIFIAIVTRQNMPVARRFGQAFQTLKKNGAASGKIKMSLTVEKAGEFINFALGNKLAQAVSIVVSGGAATVTSVSHGLADGNFFQVYGASPDGLNGNKIVVGVVDPDTFTYDAPGVPDGATTGNYISGLVKVNRQKTGEGSSEKPYAAYRIMASRPFGQSATYHDEGAGGLEETVERKRILTLEVQFFTKTETQALDPDEQAKDPKLTSYIAANDLAAEFEDRVDLTRSRAFQKQNGFSVVSVNTITDIDAFLGDRWERRALCELRINDTTRFTEAVEHYNPENLTVDLTIEGL